MTANGGRQNNNLQVTRISLNLSNASLQEFIRAVEASTVFRFTLDENEIGRVPAITVQSQEESLKNVLDKVAGHTGLEFKQVDKNIHIRRSKNKSSSLPAAPLPVAKTTEVAQIITGNVVSGKGEPLPGVTVLLKGTSVGTSTDGSGKFSLEVPETGGTLIFTFIGFVTQEVAIAGQSMVTVTLREDAKQLEEVVVVGYGTTKKSDVTGSVVSLQQEDFTQGVNTSALQLLNGRAPGVQVSQASSAPGGGVTVRVRGAGSINGSNDVLVVIDGLPGGSATAISPQDIESIEVLKDASAAAIYGTRAANGVILITTKKGSKGKPRVEYSSYVGLQQVARKLDVLEAGEYIQVLNGILADQGQAPKFTPEQISAIGKGTDWQDEIFQSALAHNNQLSFSGGSDNATYYVGLNYLNQGGVVKGSEFEKYNLRVNYQINPSDKLKVGMALNLNRITNKSILSSNAANENAGPINTALQFDPTLSTALDATGQYPRNPLIALDNPLALINGIKEQDLSNRMYSTITADYTIVSGLTATLRLGVDVANGRFDSYTSRITEKGKAAGGIASASTNENYHWLIEYLTKYEKKLNDIHHFTLLGGVTLEEFDTRTLGASSRNFLSDVTATNLLQSGDGDSNDNVTSGRNANRLNGFIGRANYSLYDRYIFTASVRADGTSRFAEGNKYAVFPSFAFAWRISEEPVLANTTLFNNLKLRMGYGQLGNQGIQNFETIQTFVAGQPAVLGNTVIQGASPARLPNTNIQWETTEEYNVGVDFGFLRGRLSGSVDYYVKNTKDQLFSKPLPLSSGFSTIRVNFGEVRNQGLELLLESINTEGAFKWNTAFTLSTLKNKVVELPDFIPQIITGNIATFVNNYSIVREGVTMNSFYGYEITGIFQQNDDIANSAQPNAKPGHPIFKDQNNNGVIDPDDRIILGNPLPRLNLGLNNSFSYKGLSLDVFLVAVQGVKALDANIIESLYPTNFDRNRIAKYYLDRWTPANPGAKYPSGINPSSYGGALAVNSLTVTDASFLRLRTLTLSYQLPLPAKKFVNNAAVYVSGDNLFTLTSFGGFDPDANATGGSVSKTSYNSYPLSRTFRLGVNLTF
ncbi:SusC/RagA family TonB-linked outer membrane protein [Adhaeribacter aerolatus]|uniref:SusC/RagA family TonB-linked outer membrane protein n=1 Tax=Adhaeribacter aerolatus TaxID=670289 RepID=A0A512AUW1_9BACT|nr:SusC/RagA family TonB-linked outer membrane protein [Adhaeribacter aerolatus]